VRVTASGVWRVTKELFGLLLLVVMPVAWMSYLVYARGGPGPLLLWVVGVTVGVAAIYLVTHRVAVTRPARSERRARRYREYHRREVARRSHSGWS
jgi:hypothetical protein